MMVILYSIVPYAKMGVISGCVRRKIASVQFVRSVLKFRLMRWIRFANLM